MSEVGVDECTVFHIVPASCHDTFAGIPDFRRRYIIEIADEAVHRLF
ncbi:uncharacterized protein METZ01_LOCUS284569 [marine metagenome]|uniref:Uncharacterized protein n=1 Tax=marine metagenome TaxID=408172 RepID=A0A382L7C5_9ZZZZ